MPGALYLGLHGIYLSRETITMRVVFCHLCGRVVVKSFLYCPYCGSAMRLGPEATGACAVFDRLEQKHTGSSSIRIEKLIAELEAIENDLEMLLHDDVSSLV